MTEVLDRLEAPDDGEFVRLTGPFRRELLAHCYRMLGSPDEAEDVVQETYLRAWRSYRRFEGRSSLRVWLYRIATNACLTALAGRDRRPLPSGLGDPGADPEAYPAPARPEIAWLRPMPDALLDAASADPSAIVASRDSLRLALIAALQHLPGRQRAVLILRDVLDWRASEVAEALGTTTAAVKSSLQRARAQLHRVAPAEGRLVEPVEPDLRALLDRYMAAFKDADIPALTRLLREDAELEMPPLPGWYRGRHVVARFLDVRVFGPPGAIRMLPTMANGQPAVAAYVRGADGRQHAHAIHVLTVTSAGIARIVVFLDRALFRWFDLPPVLDPPE